MVGVPYAGTIANVAGKIGLGRRRRYRGGRRRLQGGSSHYRTAQLLDINPSRTRVARLRKAF